MKNEKMARAMTNIDDRLIDEANITRIDRKARIPRSFTRFGSLAACLILVVGIFILAGKQDLILLDGQKLTREPRELTIVVPEPRDISIGTHSQTYQPAKSSYSYPIELAFSFSKAKKLSCSTAEMIVINDDGDIVHTGDGYMAEGKTIIRLPLTDEMSDIIISTDRGYNIVLTKDENTDQWYINLVKQK